MNYLLFNWKYKLKFKYIHLLFIAFMCSLVSLSVSLISAADTDSIGVIIPRIEGVTFYRVETVNGVRQNTVINTTLSDRQISFLSSGSLDLKVKIDDEKYFSGLSEADRESVASAFSVSGNLILENCEFNESDHMWDLKIAGRSGENTGNKLSVSLKQRQDILIEFPNFDGIELKDNDGNPLMGTVKHLRSGNSYGFTAQIKDTTKIYMTENNLSFIVGENTVKTQYSGADNIYNVTIENAVSNGKVEVADMLSINFTDIQGLSYKIGGQAVASGSTKLCKLGSRLVFDIIVNSKLPLAADQSGSATPLTFALGNNAVTQTESADKRTYTLAIDALSSSASVSSNDLLKLSFPKLSDITFQDSSGTAIESKYNYLSVMQDANVTFKAKFVSGSPLINAPIQFSAGANGISTGGNVSGTRNVTVSNMSSSAQVALNYSLLTFHTIDGVIFYESQPQCDDKGVFLENSAPKIANGSKKAIENYLNYIFYIYIDKSKIHVESGTDISGFISAGDHTVTISSTAVDSVYKVSISSIRYDTDVTPLGTKELNFTSDVRNIEFFKPTDNGTGISTGNSLSGTVKVMKRSHYQFLARANKALFPKNEYEIQFLCGEQDEVVVKKYYEEGDYIYYLVEVKVIEGGTIDVEDGYVIKFPSISGFDFYYDSGFTQKANGKKLLAGRVSATFYVKFSKDTSAAIPKINAGKNTVKVTAVNKTDFKVEVSSLKEDCEISVETVDISFPSIVGAKFDNKTYAFTQTVPYGTKLSANAVLDKDALKITDSNAVSFSAGSNTVERSSPSTQGNNFSYTITVHCLNDSTVSIGKILTMPTIYGVKFYDGEISGSSTNLNLSNLGTEIASGASKSFVSGANAKLVVEVDSSINIPHSDVEALFSAAGKNANGVFAGEKDGKLYYTVDFGLINSNAQVISNKLFTIQMPTLPSVYYYKSRSGDGTFSSQIEDKKVTVYTGSAQSPLSVFYVHFDDSLKYPVNNLPNITSSNNGTLTITTTKSGDYAEVQVTKLTANSSINIDVSLTNVSVIMPEDAPYLNFVKYSSNQGLSYSSNVADSVLESVSYGSPIMLKLCFDANVEGYSNLYKTPISTVKVKVYSAAGLENGDIVSEKAILLDTLDLKSLDADSGEFITGGVEYITDAFYPTTNVILVIEGIVPDFYDLCVVSGENEFEDMLAEKISGVLKLYKVDSNSKDETEIPFVEARDAYVVRSVPYGESVKFKYVFTDGAQDLGIKYNFSELTLNQSPYEGDSDVLDKDADDLYTSLVKSDTTVKISGIKLNVYKVTIPTSPSVNLEYVINRNDDDMEDVSWITAEKEIMVNHGQRLSMNISSNDAVKSYIKTVLATDITHNSDPKIIYDGEDQKGVAKETVARANIEKVLGNTELAITVSKKEYKIDFVLRSLDANGREILSYPDPQKLVIYENTTDDAINANYDGVSTYAPYILTERSNLVFRVVPDYKYDRSDLTISYRTFSDDDSSTSSMIILRDGIYTLSTVTQDGQIIIDGLSINNYTVEFPQTSDEVNFHKVTVENGVTVESPVAMIGPQTVTHGDTLEFVPKLREGYALSGNAVKANGEPLRLMDSKYKLSNISEDIKITADPLDKLRYSLSFPSTIEGVTFLDTLGMGVTTVTNEYMSSYSFKLSIDPKYNLSADYASVYAVPEGTQWDAIDYDPDAFGSGAIKLEKDGASNYTLSDISQNMIIIVRGITINQFYVDLPISEEGVVFSVVKKDEDGIDRTYEVTNENKRNISVANYGENFVFSAQAREGYDISDMNLTAVITQSGYETPIEKMSNGYIIQNVTSDMTVNASQIKRAKHTVNLKGDNMVFRENENSAETITSMQIDHEVGEIQFTISPDIGYGFASSGISVSVDPYQGADVTIPQVTAEGTLDGLITVTNVLQDVDLIFTGTELQIFTVTLPVDTEGISFMKLDDDDSPQTGFEWSRENEVPIGEDFEFYIRPHPGYDISNITVSTGPGEYLYSSDGVYTISNVTKNMKVEVSNISYSLYTVKLRGEDMTFYEPNGLFAQNDFNVSYKGSFQFRIVADTGYEIDLENGIKFSIGNVNIVPGDENQNGVKISKPDQNGVFTVSNVEKDIVINVSGTKKQKYNINLPTELVGAKLVTPQGDLLDSKNGPIQVEYLGEFRFEVVPEFGYNTDYVYVTIDPPQNAIVKNVDGGYVIESVVGNLDILVQGVNANEYEVYYKGVGADFYTLGGSQITAGTAKYKESFSFAIKAQEGYDLTKGYELSVINERGDEATIEYKVGELSATKVSLGDGVTLTETDRFTYTVSNVQGPLTILIKSVGKNVYSISLPTSVKGIAFLDLDGAQITGGAAAHGASFSFKIAALDGYDISNIYVTANANTVELIDGEYTLRNITEDITIEVTGVVSTRVYLNLKYVSGVIFKDVNDNELSTLEKIWVDHGSNYSFKVELDSSYSQSKDKMIVSTNPQSATLSYSRGVYTLSGITENTDILVENVELNTYFINLSEGRGIIYMDEYGTSEISGTQTVSHGDNFRFMVDPQEGFALDDIEVSVKGGSDERVQLSPVDGVYTISYVTADYTVVVENAKKETYTVEIRISDGASLLDEGGNKLANQLSVKHGDDLPFRLSLDTAYNKSSPVVMVKGRSDPILPENNFYTIRNITSNTIVEISGVTKNTYTVKFKETEGVIYKTEKKKEFKGSLDVEYGGTLAFIVDLADEYDASQFTVLLDGDKTLAANGGIYQITNVGADCEISVKYVTRNTEEDVIDIILDLPNKVSNSEDAARVVSATRAFNDLPEDRKALVTNLSKLKILQTQAGSVHHESSDVQVTGIDWNIKVVVVPQQLGTAACERLNEKMERKTVISVYEISLYDSLTGNKYEVPEDQTVSVVIPFEIPNGYTNAVIVHEKESGSIEYLDMLVSNGYAKFETSSFSMFGVAAKLIPNYVENVTDVTISLAGLTDNEEETKKQILSDALPSLLEEEQITPTGSKNHLTNKVKDDDGSLIDKLLNWLLAHELLLTVLVILAFALVIALIVYRDNKSSSQPK